MCTHTYTPTNSFWKHTLFPPLLFLFAWALVWCDATQVSTLFMPHKVYTFTQSHYFYGPGCAHPLVFCSVFLFYRGASNVTHLNHIHSVSIDSCVLLLWCDFVMDELCVHLFYIKIPSSAILLATASQHQPVAEQLWFWKPWTFRKQLFQLQFCQWSSGLWINHLIISRCGWVSVKRPKNKCTLDQQQGCEKLKKLTELRNNRNKCNSREYSVFIKPHHKGTEWKVALLFAIFFLCCNAMCESSCFFHFSIAIAPLIRIYYEVMKTRYVCFTCGCGIHWARWW